MRRPRRAIGGLAAAGVALAVACGAGCGAIDGGGGAADPAAPRPPDAAPPRAAPAGDASAGPADTAPPADTRPRPSYEGPQAPQVGKSFGRTAVPGRIRIVEDHDGRAFDLPSLLARPATLEANMTIRIRGNSTSRYAKKSYALELQDAARQTELAAPVLDMPPEPDWVLYACYADKTCFRDALAYSLGRTLGRWNPRFRFVEVVLNGEYIGLYNIIEKIKLDRHRVPLPYPAAEPSAGDLTGGYIVKRDGPGEGGTSVWTSRLGNTYTLHVPNERRITPAQRSYLVSYFDRWEAAMRAPDYRDPVTGYRKWIDTPSFVDFIIMTELAKGVDSYRRSAYLYKEPDAAGGRLHAGPLWDFDLAFGNAFSNRYPPEPEQALFTNGEALMYETFRRAAAPHNMAFWWYQLLGDPAFLRDLKCRWLELRRGPLSLATMNGLIDGWVKLTAEAERRDHARWPVLGRWIWGQYNTGGTFDEEVAFLRRYLDARTKWLDANLPGTCG
jgi:hypothetical protein